MPTGQDIVNRASMHVTKPKEPYVYGAFVPKDAPDYRGPWDCAEFGSKMIFEEAGILYGTSNHINPRTADAWSGFWLQDAREKGKLVSVAEAARTPGAVILRVGVGIVGMWSLPMARAAPSRPPASAWV
jgi:N-acetylmuramoyl-L-alanine amidase